ncbi:MAG: hypothetical protein IJX90_09570 [Blautia sp.]|nr:hypothetical protein [Blautia sp.]
MIQKEKDVLDKKIEALKPKILKAKDTYDSLLDEMSELLDQRYPERREEAIKNRLYDAYRRSGKTVDFIIDFIENADDEDDYWA